jgi:hypothetical protein
VFRHRASLSRSIRRFRTSTSRLIYVSRWTPKLRVLAVSNVGWSDWGTIASILQRSMVEIGKLDVFRLRLEQSQVHPSWYAALLAEIDPEWKAVTPNVLPPSSKERNRCLSVTRLNCRLALKRCEIGVEPVATRRQHFLASLHDHIALIHYHIHFPIRRLTQQWRYLLAPLLEARLGCDFANFFL